METVPRAKGDRDGERRLNTEPASPRVGGLALKSCSTLRCGFLLSIIIIAQFARAAASLTPHLPNTGIERGYGPVGVIFDTDMWSDIDDALALSMLHALTDRGEINLLAVTISTNDRWSASYVSLIDRFYEHPQIPIGRVGPGGPDLESFRKRFPGVNWPVTRYTERLSERTNEDGTWVYPRNLSDGSSVPEATSLLRKTLAAQPDKSVVLIQVGYSTNLARLLKSPADGISALNGKQLIARKVRMLSVMAGNFGEAVMDGKVLPKGSQEFNLLADVPSAQTLFSDWPTPIVASGFEVGLALPYPRESVEHDYQYVRNHPIQETYLTFCEERKASENWTCPHAHSTFDLTAVLYAVRPDRGYFSLSNQGSITVLDDGSSRFEEATGGRDRYLILRPDQKERVLEALTMLASEPPVHRASP